MKDLAFSAIIVLSTFSLSFSQNQKKPEFFGGFSIENVDTGITSTDLGTTTTLDNRFRANGFNVAGTGSLTKRLGLTGDFSAHFDSRDDSFSVTTGRSKLSLYNITGGPQFRFLNSSRFTPFVRGLAGIARRNLSETFTTISYTDNPTSFALNLGGGVDYKINDRFAWRLGQFDYNPIFARSRIVNATPIPDRTLNGFRFSTGIVIK
jgi:opacity protein-like surface antigen